VIEYPLFIGGSWLNGVEERFFEITNPATEEVIGRVPDAVPQDMKRAIECAARVQDEWAATSAYERAKILFDAASLMRRKTEDLARIMTIEEGKPLVESRGEISYAASFLEWFAEEAKRVYGDIIPASSRSKRIFVLKRPVGICAAITPWNFPAAMITRKLGPALAAGCTMIVKPSEVTPLSAFEIAKIFEEVGLPKGVLSVVVGNNSAGLAKVLMEDFRVRKISFTGSTEVGKLLMEQASSTVKRVSLELGGQAPFIVFDDSDVNEAVNQTILAKMRGMGETCVAANRIYVQDKVYDEYVSKLADKLRTLRVGNGLEDGVTVGPLIDKFAIEKVERHVEDAVKKGATPVLGGERTVSASGYFYPPTILTNVDDSMLVTKEETFGPVAAILRFHTEEEVIARANQTQAGLAAYYFTKDVNRVFRLAENLQFGILGANDGLPSTAQAPFGGVKESGLGREGSKYGIEEYLDIKYLSLGGM
jgi:succinate-semialdehyde dehydrogenase / glutarate-semialdehyde dehydrogenase